MRKRISILLGIGLILTAVSLAVFWPRDEGPLYDGKPVSYWMTRTNFVRASPGGSGRGGWVRTFPRFDTNAVPYLIKALETKDGPARKFYFHAWNKSPGGIRKWLPQPLAPLLSQRNAVDVLGQLGPEAKPAIPALLRIIEDDDDPAIVVLALMDLNHPADKDYRRALFSLSASDNSTIRKFARDALNSPQGSIIVLAPR